MYSYIDVCAQQLNSVEPLADVIRNNVLALSVDLPVDKPWQLFLVYLETLDVLQYCRR
jgi:hypothetical protein